MATNWRVYQGETVACKLEQSEIPGFLRKQVMVGPNEAAMVLRDGIPSEVLTESRMKVAGLFDRVKSMFGMGPNLQVFFLDLSAFDVTLFLGQSATESASARSALVSTNANTQNDFQGAAKNAGWADGVDCWSQESVSQSVRVDVCQVSVAALSADREIVQAICNIRLRVDIDPEGPVAGVTKVASLLKGKRAVATWDIAAIIREEIFAKILVPEIAKVSASNLRSEQGLLSRLESQSQEFLQRTLSSCGLRLERFSIAWGLTDDERAEIAQKRAEREEKALEFTKTRRIAHLKREQEIEKIRLQNLQELKTAQARGDEGLKDLLLTGDLGRDMIQANHQVDLASVDSRIRDITLEVEKKESLARLEERRAQEDLRLDIEDKETKQRNAARLAAIDASDKEMWSMIKMQIEMSTQKNDREMARRRQENEAEFRKMQADIEDRFQQRKLKLDESLARMGLMERLVSQGLSAGATDASVLNTMLKQMTEQEYATTTDAMVKARSEGLGSGNNLETYRQALADERSHQVDMTKLSADMMQAAKPTQQPIILPSIGGPQSPPPIMNPGVIHQAPASACNHCGGYVQSGWKACPACGQPLVQTRTNCKTCLAAVQPNWRACPACGNPL